MAHKTLIGGTAYEVSGGKTLIGGTAYNIAGGKTLIGGTGYDISFINLPATGTALSDCTPEEIQAVAQAGQAANYWSVGDTIGIALSGTVGSLTLSGTYYAFILGFDHNADIEGSNTIHFQFGKDAYGAGIAFADSGYSGESGTFYIYSTTSSEGGWASSHMRNTICAKFLNVMPTDWQNVITSCIKYSDNTGGRSNEASYVTTTSDKIWLLAEYEVFGTCLYANQYEQNYQKQYNYYAKGNSKVKYQHNYADYAASSDWYLAVWWLRSARYYGSTKFCSVNTSGEASETTVNRSYGFAPGFMVA